ncbi:aspartic peptidase domain-containing protein [Mycena vulgaris]|nr:aspartic peptidase domain-containing protein [Mycena vulgaris]
MVSSSSILHTLLLTWTTSQNDTGYSDPPPSSNPSALVFPIAARWNTTKAFNSGQRGASRASFLRGKHHSRHQTSSARALISDPIEDDTIVYVASVMIGSLGTIYNLIVDTTSGNTWVGAGKPFLTTSTSRSAGSNVRVEYANKVFEGVELLDRVEIANIAMPNKSIGVFQTTNTGLGGIPGVDGILGIGPEELCTLEINATLGVPTIVQTLSCQRNITAQLFAIALQPTTGVMSLNGEISWGAVDTTKFTGPVVFSPIASQEPSSSFWSTNMTFSYGATSLFAGSAPGIIDTGSTLIYLATDAYSRYLMLTGATLDPAHKLPDGPKYQQPSRPSSSL